jgi:GH18 family chitinase
MTYDLGDWTDYPDHKGAGEHSLPEHVRDSVRAWRDTPGSANARPWAFKSWGMGASVEKIGVGLPFYGRGFNGTSSRQSASFRELTSYGITKDGNAYKYKDRNYWLPGPELVCERVKFAVGNRLQHVIIWELSQDLRPDDAKSLLRLANEARRQVTKQPVEAEH